MPSVIDQQPFNEYTGNGVTTLFAYEFQILDAADMVVRVDGVTIPSSSYTLTGVGVQAGGTVEFGTAPANGTTVLLSREMTLERDTDYQEQGDLQADTLNNDFNRLWLAFQEFYSGGRGVPTALRVPLGESIDPLPAAAAREGYLLGFGGGSWALVPGQSGSATSLALDLANTSKGAYLLGVKAALSGAASRTQGAKNGDFVSLLDFDGVDPTGVADSTVGVQAAINSGKRIYCPEGTYKIGQVTFPNVIGGTPVHFWGAGMGKTVFIANAANITLFRKVNTSGSIDGGTIGNFSVKPHASGSNKSAILATGFRSCEFTCIQGLSNGTAGFYALIEVAAAPWLSYRNTFRGIFMDSALGYTYGILFNNGGTGNSASNSNIARIVDCWFNQCVGMTTLIDVTRSAMVVIENCIFEGCAGALAIASGNTTSITHNWFELMGADIGYAMLADGTANDGSVTRNYFSTPHTIDFTGVRGNVWLNNTEAGVQTWVNNNGANVRFAASQLFNVTAPTIAYSSGQTGALAFVGAVQRQTDMSGSLTWLLRYSWTAGAAPSNTKFAITIPTGWAISQTTAECFRNSSGEPMKTGVTAASEVWVHNEFNDAHEIVITVTITKVN